MRDLEGLLARLIRNGVDFVIVGGFAAVAHGVTLLTQDIDICCDFSPANLMKLQQAVADLHPVHRMTPARIPLQLTPASCAGLKNLYLDTDLGQLDCLGRIAGVGGFREVLDASVEIELGDGRCRILSLDALIRAKDAMSRPRDREAADQLRAIRSRRSQA